MKVAKKKVFILLMAAVMLIALCVPVSAKTYKAKKVTAKQITTELSKKFSIKDVENYTKKTEGTMIGLKNGYKSKTTFIDKKYPRLYCSIEVFKNSNLAYRRDGYLEALRIFDDSYGFEHDAPFSNYIYKNILIRLNGHMPKSYEKKYLNAIKKIVK